MTRRRYDKRTKLTAVLAADASTLTAAAEATGIPRKTIAYWLDRPEFAELRQNAREAMADDAMYVARLAWRKLGQAIADDELEPRDLVMAAGMATEKSQLLNGGATARSESRDITGTLSDSDLIAAIHEADRLTSDRRAPEEAADTPQD